MMKKLILQIDLVVSSAAPTGIIEPSSKEALHESSPTTSGFTPITFEDEDIPADPPRQARVRHNHPPQQLLGNLD
jgi:hypothetical protein